MQKTLKNRIKVFFTKINIKRNMWNFNGYKYIELTGVNVEYDWDTNTYKVSTHSEVPHHTTHVLEGLISNGKAD